MSDRTVELTGLCCLPFSFVPSFPSGDYKWSSSRFAPYFVFNNYSLKPIFQKALNHPVGLLAHTVLRMYLNFDYWLQCCPLLLVLWMTLTLFWLRLTVTPTVEEIEVIVSFYGNTLLPNFISPDLPRPDPRFFLSLPLLITFTNPVFGMRVFKLIESKHPTGFSFSFHLLFPISFPNSSLGPPCYGVQLISVGIYVIKRTEYYLPFNSDH